MGGGVHSLGAFLSDGDRLVGVELRKQSLQSIDRRDKMKKNIEDEEVKKEIT